MRKCKNYVGVTCVNGNCPMANREEYIERDIPVIDDCDECFYYKSCEDCALADTEYCDGRAERGAEK